MSPEARQEKLNDLKIGWIGVGKMGSPMARNLQKAGFTVVVYDADLSRLTDSGFERAQSVEALSRETDIVISMIPNDQALREIVLGPDRIRLGPGKFFVDLSTVSPAVSAECGRVLEQSCVDYIRGAVSGSTELAEAARLTVMLSGPTTAIERCRLLFNALGNKIFVVGTGEEARYLKLVINTMVAATAVMCAEALVLGERGGIEWNRMLDVIADSVVASPLVNYKIQLLRKRDFTPAFSCQQMVKDLGLAVDAAQACGISLPLLSDVNALFHRTVAEGEGDLDFFAALRSVERSAGIDPGH